jgi:hypothetical protein
MLERQSRGVAQEQGSGRVMVAGRHRGRCVRVKNPTPFAHGVGSVTDIGAAWDAVSFSGTGPARAGAPVYLACAMNEQAMLRIKLRNLMLILPLASIS